MSLNRFAESGIMRGKVIKMEKAKLHAKAWL
ncbi:hypothetical protein NTGM5_140030 [Candidatus Nitrotoga sp. M5]|nr:hypothetical protein NTGM5_140030 [Candidatus Nitrotoga sp. M5]